MPYDGCARVPALDEQRVDLVLGELDLARRLRRRDELRVRRDEVEQRNGREPVVHDDDDGRERVGAAHRDEARICRPRADEVDGHEPSSSRPP